MITFAGGAARGDEGKGRIVDGLAAEYDIVARAAGGPNAGHTVVLPDGVEHKLHLLPSGIAHPHIMNIIGNGTVIDPVKLAVEIENAALNGVELDESRLLISDAAHLILPYHITIDELRETGAQAQGTTKSGIGPAYADKAMRHGIRTDSILHDPLGVAVRVSDDTSAYNALRVDAGLDPMDVNDTVERFMDSAVSLGSMIIDTALYLNERLRDGDDLLVEGAQGFLLDIDHGMYDAVTSSTTTAAGIFAGLGIPPQEVHSIGVVKAVQSHVGGGPFPTEIHDQSQLDLLHGDLTTIDAEQGTTTGRKRRLGHLDIAALRRAIIIAGFEELALTKLDWVPRYGESVLLCVGYKHGGRYSDISPSSAHELAAVEPQYIELPTWSGDISSARRFDDLPVEAREYVTTIEDLVDKPIEWIGVGPRRDEMVSRD